MNCKQCHAPANPSSSFCNQCGATLGITDSLGTTRVLAPKAGLSSALPAAPVLPALALQPAPPMDPQHAFTTSAMAAVNQREVTVFLLDVSSSMDEMLDSRFTKIASALRAAGTLALQKQRIDDLDEVGIVSFNYSGHQILAPYPIITHKREIFEAIESLSAGGGTDLNAGLCAAGDLFDWNRGDVTRRIVLLTDGNGGDPIGTAKDLKSRGVKIDVIGVGPDTSDVNEKLLRKVASTIQNENRYRFIKDQKTLVDHVTVLANKTLTA